jgi:hypothetical protein
MAEIKFKHSHKEWVIIYKRHVYDFKIVSIYSSWVTGIQKCHNYNNIRIMCSVMFMFKEYSDKT